MTYFNTATFRMNEDRRLPAGRMVRLMDAPGTSLVQVSPFGGNPRWQLAGLFVKGDDDLRQERATYFERSSPEDLGHLSRRVHRIRRCSACT